ncbi:hypothetical protein N7470_004747 [Penicillium chermesinum]|nr:hypothetical protein N7470_004747 [Penicillium chermesinum]
MPPGVTAEESQDTKGNTTDDPESGSPSPPAKRDLPRLVIRRCFWGLLIILYILKILHLAQQKDALFFESTIESKEHVDHPQDRIFHIPHYQSRQAVPAVCASYDIHGHQIPFHDAIASGCTGIEITVYPSGRELLVGHHPDTLARGLDLHGIYLDPLLDLIRRHNRPRQRLRAGMHDGEISGVFLENPRQSLVLLIRLNMNEQNAETAWALLSAQLKSLREAGYLTHYEGSTLVQGPVTIVASGDAPFHRVPEGSAFRDIFYDLPLADVLSTPAQTWDHELEFNMRNVYYVSVDFHETIGEVSEAGFAEEQILRIRDHVRKAHERGLKLRYWNSVGWQSQYRNYVRQILLHEGVDSITIQK